MTNSSVSNDFDRETTIQNPTTTTMTTTKTKENTDEEEEDKEVQQQQQQQHDDENQHRDGRNNEMTEKADVSSPVADSQTKKEEEGGGGGEVSKKVVLSKNQMKKRKRYEKLMAKKKERKEFEKARRIAKAEAEGRDLDQERRELEERTKSGEGHKRRQEAWLRRFSSAKDRFQVCLDCSFDDRMSEKERSSLALQIRYSYARNKRSSHPVYFSVCGLENNGTTLTQLNKVSGFPDQWTSKLAFAYSSQSILDYYSEKKDKLVYLTGDSDTTLETLDNDKIYLIGGIVDRNRHKFVTRDKAKELGIATAKLPLDSHWNDSSATKILTCNHVFDILVTFGEQIQQNDTEKSWKHAFTSVLPKRKNIDDSHDKKEDNNNNNKNKSKEEVETI